MPAPILALLAGAGLGLGALSQALPAMKEKLQPKPRTMDELSVLGASTRPTPTPTPTPTPRLPDRYFDYEPYIAHMNPKPKMPQPPKEIGDILWNEFPQDATRSAITSFQESGFNPEVIGVNTKGKLAGTQDMGVFQVNAGLPDDRSQISTFDDLLRRKPELMRQAGATDYNSLLDPGVNARTAKINFDESPQGWWGRWFALRNNGFLPEHFTPKTSPF